MSDPREFLAHLKAQGGAGGGLLVEHDSRRTLHGRIGRRRRVGAYGRFWIRMFTPFLFERTMSGRPSPLTSATSNCVPMPVSRPSTISCRMNCGGLPLARLHLVPDHHDRLVSARVVAVVGEVALARHDVALAVAVDVDIVHGMRLRERFIDHVLLERLAVDVFPPPDAVRVGRAADQVHVAVAVEVFGEDVRALGAARSCRSVPSCRDEISRGLCVRSSGASHQPSRMSTSLRPSG